MANEETQSVQGCEAPDCRSYACQPRSRVVEYSAGSGGRFKDSDNLVVDRSPDGSAEVRFVPVSAASTEYFTVELIDRYKDALTQGRL